MNRGDFNSKVIRACTLLLAGMALSIVFMVSTVKGDSDIPQISWPEQKFNTTSVFVPADPCGLDVVVCNKSTKEILQILTDFAPNEKLLKDAIRIANCESSFDQYAKNKYSSAKGLFQFTDGTWNAYCSGDQFDVMDSAKCFFKLYPDHPDWWQCK